MGICNIRRNAHEGVAYRRHLLLNRNPHQFPNVRKRRDEPNSKGAAGKLSSDVDLLPKPHWIVLSTHSDEAESASLRNCRREFRSRSRTHWSIHDRVVDSQKVTQSGF